MKLQSLLENAKCDRNGIWVTHISKRNDVTSSQEKWEEIYNFTIDKLEADRKEFTQSKLSDHVGYIEPSYKFNEKTVYLEIGCGPSYLAEYLMKKYDCYFIGIDFNYQILNSLNQYLKKKKFSKFILVYADIAEMPLKNELLILVEVMKI